MQSINQETLQKAGELISALNTAEIGDIHTVTLIVDDRTGDCVLRVETKLSNDILMVIQQ